MADTERLSDKVRHKFEKWQVRPLEWQDNPKHPKGGRYVDDRVEDQWIVWQAAYRMALEDAAKLARGPKWASTASSIQMAEEILALGGSQ